MSETFNLEEFEEYKLDPTFNGIIKSVEDNNIEFKQLPENDKYMAMYLMMSGKADAVEGLWDVVYKRRIPSPKEFLTVEYIGPFADLIYPKWREVFINMFSDTSKVKEGVFTGCIGAGKSTMAMLCHFYNLYRINSLRHPQLVLGSGPNKAMIMQLMSLTLDKASSTLLDGVREFLNSSTHYRKIPKRKLFNELTPLELANPIVPYLDTGTGSTIEFPNTVRIKIGSTDTHGIGEDLFAVHMDEIDFKIARTVDQVFDSYAQLTERIRSRFLGQRFTLSTLVSSITKQTGAMNNYIKNITPDDKETIVCSYAIWDIKYPGLFEKHGYFYAMRGTKKHPSKIMDELEMESIDKGDLDPDAGCDFIKIPNNYKKDFEQNIERSLMNLAGVASSSDERPFDDLSTVEDENLAPIVDVIARLRSTEPLWRQLPAQLFIKTPEGKRLKRCPDAKRYMHLDLATTGYAGLSIVHKEMSREFNRIMYVVDFAINVSSPDSISYESIQSFVCDLVQIFGIRLEVLTADQYQSTGMLQFFEKAGIAKKVGRLSVDRTSIPYNTFGSIVSENLFKCGLLHVLKEQLENLAINQGKPYMPPNMRKDVADTVCGGVYNAFSNASDIPVDFYEDLSRDKTRPIEEILPEGFEEFND